MGSVMKWGAHFTLLPLSPQEAAWVWESGGGDNVMLLPALFTLPLLISILFQGVVITHLKVFFSMWMVVQIEISGREQVLGIPIPPSCSNIFNFDGV